MTVEEEKLRQAEAIETAAPKDEKKPKEKIKLGRDTKDKGEPLLRAEHVSEVFGGLKAVSDFNFEIYPGELVGLIGPTGAC